MQLPTFREYLSVEDDHNRRRLSSSATDVLLARADSMDGQRFNAFAKVLPSSATRRSRFTALVGGASASILGAVKFVGPECGTCQTCEASSDGLPPSWSLPCDDPCAAAV